MKAIIEKKENYTEVQIDDVKFILDKEDFWNINQTENGYILNFQIKVEEAELH